MPVTRHKYLRIALLLIAGVLVSGWVIWKSRSPIEPRYEGKRLSVWLKQMESWMGDTNDPAFVACSRMDTNAIPFLIETIRSPDSRLENLIHKANRKQDVVHIP